MLSTIQQLLLNSRKQIDPLDAEILIAHVINKPREFVIAHPEAMVGRSEDQKIERLIKKRKAGAPLAYLTGHKEFYGLNFIVNKYTLIPRPDTETLVEMVIEEINRNNVEIARLLASLKLGRSGPARQGNIEIIMIDVGTGNGCIPIAINKTIKQCNNITMYAIDISKKALQIARKNAKKHHAKIKFLHGNLLSPLSSFPFPLSSPIIITANLPYLSKAQYLANPDLKHEPKSALVAKNNGLYYYEQLLKQIAKFLISYFLFPITLFLEIDPSQSKLITRLINEHLPTAKIEIKKDLGERDRVVTAKL